MTQYTLTVLDTSQIQSYVFGSNRLTENVGGRACRTGDSSMGLHGIAEAQQCDGA